MQRPDAAPLNFINQVNFAAEKDPVQQLASKLLNPFTQVLYWVRGEIYDAQSLTAAIIQRATTNVAAVSKLRNKLTNQSTELEGLKAGKSSYSLKTLFKSTESRGQYAVQLE